MKRVLTTARTTRAGTRGFHGLTGDHVCVMA